MSSDTNHEAWQKTLKVLRELGRIDPLDEARVHAIGAMARALDFDSENSALWRHYLTELRDIAKRDESGTLNDELNSLYPNVRDS